MTPTQPEALRLAEKLDDSSLTVHHKAAAELRRLHEAHDWQHKMAGERLRRIEKLEAKLKQEKTSRQAAQIENEELKYRLARSGVEQRRAILAERESCAELMEQLHTWITNAAANAIRARTAPRVDQDIGDIVVTWNHDRTKILAVTRQDKEGKILKVIAEVP